MAKKYEKMSDDDARKLGSYSKLLKDLIYSYQRFSDKAVGRTKCVQNFYDMEISLKKITDTQDDLIKVGGHDVDTYGPYDSTDIKNIKKIIDEVTSNKDDHPSVVHEKHKNYKNNAAYRQPKPDKDFKWWLNC